jgi:hypothetical protein
VARFVAALPALLRHISAVCRPAVPAHASGSRLGPLHEGSRAPAPPTAALSASGGDHAGPSGDRDADASHGDAHGQRPSGGADPAQGAAALTQPQPSSGGWSVRHGVARMLAAVGEAGRAGASRVGRRARRALARRPEPGAGPAAPEGAAPEDELRDGRCMAAEQAGRARAREAGTALLEAGAPAGCGQEWLHQAAALDDRGETGAGGWGQEAGPGLAQSAPRVVLAAAAGYEGEAATVAAAALMLLTRCAPHEALAELAHRHTALQVRPGCMPRAWAPARALARRLRSPGAAGARTCMPAHPGCGGTEPVLSGAGSHLRRLHVTCR